MIFFIIKKKLFVFSSFLLFISSNCIAKELDLFLLQPYRESQDVTGWVMSEKLDGVRAYWDGQQLISRGGNVFSAPQSFLKNFPPFALDGELWTKRNDFENIVSIVRRLKPDDRWSQITYRVFEVPNQKSDLYARLSMLKAYLKFVTTKQVPIKIVDQIEIKNKTHLNDFFQKVVSQGGEGVVVRNPAELYQTGRLDSAFKLKTHRDEDCEVTGYKPGRGKYRGLVGSLKCKLKNQRVINIGSGLSDKQRQYPPAVGQLITFKHYGLTGNGLPRFPVFLRERVISIDSL